MRPVPKGLAAAVAKAKKHIDKRYVYGLPHYGLSTKMKLELVELGDDDLLEEHEIDVDENPNWLPFAMFKDEPQFLAISTQSPYPVAMWEHEDGKFYPVWETFDDFVGKVIDKKDKTPYEKLEKQLEKINTLVEKDQHADALGLIEPILAQFPKLPPGRDFEDDNLARAHNLHGLALKGVKRFADARAAFERSADAGDTYAELNILDLLEDEKAPQAVIDRGLKVREDRYLDTYGRAWLARYIGFAHLDLGDRAKAEAELRRIVDDFAITDAEKVAKQRENLEKYIAENRPGAAIAREFLAWFKPKTYDVTPEEAKANRAWWDALPEGMREALLKEIKKPGETATDDTIARTMDVDDLRVDEDVGLFDDKMLLLFLKLERLEHLGFHGDPDSIEILRKLPKLERLTINGDVVKNFEWPTRADRDLWKACEAGDKKGIEKALAAGANLHSRGEWGQTPLMLVTQTRDMALIESFIKRGADPWTGSQLDANDIFYFMGGEDKERIEKLAVKSGIPHPETTPFRLLEIERMPQGATFERMQTDLELDDGEPIADKWPADAKVIMESPKKHNKLYDLTSLGYDTPVVSEKIAEVLRGLPNIELLPVKVLDHSKKVRPEKYYILNPLAKDCLVVEKCVMKWNHINPNSASEAAAYVIDPARTDGAQMFRPTILNSRPTIVTKELAKKLEGFSGVNIRYLPR
jgi:tetratricopeptide (TPR) repeat protein